MVLFFLPYLISSILLFRKFEKITESENHIMLSTSNFNVWDIAFVGLIVYFCISNLTFYTGILLFSALLYLFFEYTVSKRRVISIDDSGFDELGKNKHRGLNEITSLEIYPNNIEFKFNENEILQINKNELVRPEWNTFVNRIGDVKTYANNL
jgi:hypothetical protein